jgi:hypothetical protein
MNVRRTQWPRRKQRSQPLDILDKASSFMSSYRNFVADFPKRCQSLLEEFYHDAVKRDREVTLLLAVATTAIIIPFERLRLPNDQHDEHPSNDRKQYDEAAIELDAVIDQSFLTCGLWDDESRSWGFRKKVYPKEKPIDDWLATHEKVNPISKDKTARSILKHLRNALAHGNIFTLTRPREIAKLIFLSKPYEDTESVNWIEVAPDDFYTFLDNWCNFLDSLQLNQKVEERYPVAI